LSRKELTKLMVTLTRLRTPRPGLTLAVIVTCQLMIILDATVMTIALPKIQSGLGFSPAGLSWVQNAYLLTFGGLLLLGGRAGDILGRRRVYVTGVLIFTVASLAGGLAGTPGWLIAARIAQGVGAALAAPGALALINTSIPEGPERIRAIGIYSSVSGAGAAIGMIVGGLITSIASWRWALFINVPIGLVIIALVPLVVAETARRPGRFDLIGALTSTLGMTALVYGFVRASESGWDDGITVVSFIAAVVLLVAFVVAESRTAQPIMPLRLWASRVRASAFVSMILVPAAMFGAFFFLTQFLQAQLHFTPLAAGLGMLPLPVMIVVVVRYVPRLQQRFGQLPVIVTGLSLVAVADLWLTMLTPGTGYFAGLFGPTLLLGLGVGMSFVPLSLAVLDGVGPDDSGAASGAMQALQQAGGAVGLAVLVSTGGLSSAFTVSAIFILFALINSLVFLRRTA
jgi:EmrB/QacA subfamily drug resistance transporter